MIGDLIYLVFFIVAAAILTYSTFNDDHSGRRWAAFVLLSTVIMAIGILVAVYVERGL